MTNDESAVSGARRRRRRTQVVARLLTGEDLMSDERVERVEAENLALRNALRGELPSVEPDEPAGDEDGAQ